MHLTIITGASRGLGHALAQQCLDLGHHVLSIARQAGEFNVPQGAKLTTWRADLALAAPVALQLEQWLNSQAQVAWSSASLVNNAAALQPLAPMSFLQSEDLVNACRVGLEAPMVLTAGFLRATRDWPCVRKVVLVSSGLGRRGMAGSASYCAVKAGLDNLARAVALEEASAPNGARVSSVAPGIIDTDMQVQLRGADATLFPERERFQAIQQAGGLDSPAEAAAKLLAYMNRADFGKNPVGDVRDA